MFTLRIHPLRLMLPNVRFGVAPVHHRTAVVDLPGLTWRGRFDAGQRTIEGWCWASDSGGFAKRMVIYPATGQTETRPDFGGAGATAGGVGIRRA